MENNKRVSLVYSGSKHFSESAEALNNMFNVVAVADNVLLEDHLNKMSLFSTPDVIMIEADDEELVFSLVEKIKSNPLTSGLIIILIGDRQDLKLKLRAIKAKVHDLYVHPYEVDVLNERLNFLIKFKLIKPNIEQLSVIKKRNEYHVPYPKRIFDMIASGAVLLVLSPILLLVAILIKLDSKGPVIYKSKRVGTGYRIFDFYKFR